MIDYKNFFNALSGGELSKLSQLEGAVESGLCTRRYGDLPGWYAALGALPHIQASSVDLQSRVRIGQRSDASDAQWQALDNQLRALIPWRKGPFEVFGVAIDTEWHSDWKWDRLAPYVAPLAGRNVLDVGCGNGYHCLRMYGQQARRVVGIDPSPRFVVQFYMLKRYLGEVPVDVLPVGIEALPANLNAFDTTFSMGVLYHRRSPMDHLRELKDTLVSGGELVLETLVTKGPLGHTLVPEGRYAMMNNVWFLPSCLTLESWLRKAGFKNVRTVDLNTTSVEEQRSTEWMRFHSLPEFLDASDHSKTVEGHPAPQRAVVLAEKP